MQAFFRPGRKRDGSLLTGLACFLLIVSYGLLSFVPG